MVKEDLIKQIAGKLSQRLLDKGANPVSHLHPLVILGEEASESLRNAAAAALPGCQMVASSATPEQLASCSTIVLLAPSLDLASKICQLQTDCPTAAFIINALFANKRVVAIAEGMLSAGNQLRPGLQRAVLELRDKLSDLGIEFVTITELNSLPQSQLSSATSSSARPSMERVNERASVPVSSPFSARLPILSNQPVTQHPSQQKMGVNSALNDFVEFLQTKQCTMEKGKPCDQCDICNTLGF